MKSFRSMMSPSVLLTLLVILFSCAPHKTAPVFPEDHAAKLEWWKDARFGMFIHWGPVSLKGKVISFAGDNLQPISTIVEMELDGSVMDILPMEIGSQSLSYNKPVSASCNTNPQWSGINSINNGDWVGHAWSPAKEDQTPWAEIDLGKPETISKAIIYESGQSVKDFEIQILQGETWKPVYTGTTIGPSADIVIQYGSAVEK